MWKPNFIISSKFNVRGDPERGNNQILCLSEKTCHGFKHEQGSCYLFNLEDSPRNLINNHEDEKVYLNMEFLEEKLANLYQNHDYVPIHQVYDHVLQ